MKKAAFILGTLFGSLTLMGALFKIMHWPGAGISLVIGMTGFALIGLPLLMAYRYQKS